MRQFACGQVDPAVLCRVSSRGSGHPDFCEEDPQSRGVFSGGRRSPRHKKAAGAMQSVVDWVVSKLSFFPPR